MHPLTHTITHLVQHLIKVTQLGHFLHDLLPHEEWCVDWSVALTIEDIHGILDQCLLKKHNCTLKEKILHTRSNCIVRQI